MEYTDTKYFNTIEGCWEYIKQPYGVVKLMHGWEACIGKRPDIAGMKGKHYVYYMRNYQ
jgi:hypothetical protein